MERNYDLIDIDQEKSEEAISEKVDADYSNSKTYWQDYKETLGDYFHDFLAWKENIRDSEKSNTFIPLPTAAVHVLKARLKSAILSTYPYFRVVAHQGLNDQANKLTLKYNKSLENADFKKFLDLIVLDVLVFGTAIWQSPWRVVYQDMPAFQKQVDPDMSALLGQEISWVEPVFNEKGNRVFASQITYDDIALDNISIFDHYLPKAATDFENTPYHIIRFRKSIPELEKETYIVDVGGLKFRQPIYKNLERLREPKTKDPYTSQDSTDADKLRTKEATKQGQYKVPEGEIELIQYTTKNKIIVKPVGTKFLIRNDPNPTGRNLIGGAKIFPISNEPYGLGIVQIMHRMVRTQNEIVDIIMDQLNLEDNKNWIVSDKIDHNEVGRGQGTIITVPNYDGPVKDQVGVIETRAIAQEIFPLIQFFDGVIQKVSSAPNVLTGLSTLGAETAYENQMIMSGALGRVEDMLLNLEATLGKPLAKNIHYLHKLNFSKEEAVQEFGGDGSIVNEIRVSPEDAWIECSNRFEWAGKEKSVIEERAQLTNWLQVVSQIPPENWNPILQLLIRMLFLTGKPANMMEIDNALQMTMQQSQQMQMFQQQMAIMQAQTKLTSGTSKGKNVAPGKSQGEATKNIMSQIAGSVNSLVPQGG